MTPPPTDPLTTLLEHARTDRVYSGAAWSAGTADGPVRRGHLGTLAWNGEPVTEDTGWDLASLTKPVAGLVVMALVERGLLALTDPVAMHLPEYAGTDKADLTVWHLLTHTSGIPGGQRLYRDHPDRDGLLAAVRDLPLRGGPGTRVEYSSQGFIVLGLVAEAAAGRPLDALVREYVAEPLGATDLTYNPPRERWRRTAATEECAWRGRLIQGTVHDENAEVLGGISAHAGLFATLADVERLGLALVRGGRAEHGRLLAPRTLAVMTRPATDHLNLRRSLAWQGNDLLSTLPGDLMSGSAYGHAGFTGTSLWVDPELGLYVTLLTNRVHPERDASTMPRLRPRFHNLAVTAVLAELATGG
ncbi:serine hydrolase domain-containing protein [Actinopolymorpha rutila]|uniref:CubicO group peptidase (Beta-lactamase class C family) n=1 Tax=Actinopolymorpha rutila TaxID=446787 RepID=A0A852ZAX9_9ACTN|nr:CubicO group peptidase (beta-lactamase class C family) [Actinopolymorpha rutila]